MPSLRRLGSTIGFAAAGTSLAVLSRLAPEVAGRRAAHMWCSPPTKAGRRKDNRPAGGSLTSVPGENGQPIVVEEWGDGPIVLLVHGWGGWRGHLGAFVEPLVAAGFRVVSFDALSHGDSGPGEYGPRHSSGGELARSLACVTRDIGQPHAVIAHSLGCAATTLDIAGGILTPSSLVFVSPSPELSTHINAFTQALHLAPRAMASTTAEIAKMARYDLRDFDIAEVASAGLTPAPLIVHDELDRESPYDAGVRIAQSWAGAQLVSTRGLGHLRIMRDPDVVRIVVDHVALPVRAGAAETDGNLGA